MYMMPIARGDWGGGGGSDEALPVPYPLVENRNS